MDLFDVIRACVRRWYAVLPILLATAAIAYGYYRSVAPVYYANAVVGLAQSNESPQFRLDGTPVPRNGLLDAGGNGAALITNIAVLSFGSEARANVVAAGGKPDFVVRIFPTPAAIVSSGLQLPLIMVETTQPDAESAIKTTNLAALQVDKVLQGVQRQAGVIPNLMVRGFTVSPPVATLGVPSRGRTLALITVAGGALAVLTAVLLDSFFTRRNSRVPTTQVNSPNRSEEPSTELLFGTADAGRR